MNLRRGLVLLGASALAVAGVVVVSAAFDSPPAASPTVVARPTAAAVPEESAPSAPAPELTGSQAAVEPDEPVVVVEDYEEAEPVDLGAEASDGTVVVELAELDAVDGTGAGVGERSGPALLVELVIRNESREAVDLDFAVANLYGAQGAPSALLTGDPRSSYLVGQLASGESARGTYVFRAPEDPGPVKFTLSYTPEAPAVSFVGEVVS